MKRKANTCRSRDDEREGDGEEEDANKGQESDADIGRTPQRAPRDPQESLDDDHENGGLDAEEGRLDDRDLTEISVGDAQAQHDDGARQNEEKAGGKPAQGAVQPPADISGELHCLGTRQQHAEIERVQVPVLGDPTPLLDEHAMHQRDLARRSAEGQQADLGPDGKGLLEGRSG